MPKTLWFKPQRDALTGEPINAELKEHALGMEWQHRKGIAFFHEWAERFNIEFKLGLETPAIAIDRMPVRTYGTYRLGRNGLGVRHQITLNERHLERPVAEQLQTLLHEQLHQWQQQWGRHKDAKNGYHNQEFRVMAKRFGLIVNDRGYHVGVEPGPLTRLMARFEVETKTLLVAGEQPPFTRRPRGSSKMKKWTCSPGCTNVRCAVQLRARCMKCGLEFVCEDDRT